MFYQKITDLQVETEVADFEAIAAGANKVISMNEGSVKAVQLRGLGGWSERGSNPRRD